jgi:hypothetical protein
MQTDTAAEYLIKKFQRERERIVGHILKGVSFEQEYYRSLGLIQGFDYAIELIKVTAKKVANDEELQDDE